MSLSSLLGIVDIPDSFLTPKKFDSILVYYQSIGNPRAAHLVKKADMSFYGVHSDSAYANFDKIFPKLLYSRYESHFELNCDIFKKNLRSKGRSTNLLKTQFNSFYVFSDDKVETYKNRRLKNISRTANWDNIHKIISQREVNEMVQRLFSNKILYRLKYSFFLLTNNIKQRSGLQKDKYQDLFDGAVSRIKDPEFKKAVLKLHKNVLKSGKEKSLSFYDKFQKNTTCGYDFFNDKKFNVEKELLLCFSHLQNNDFNSFDKDFSLVVVKCSSRIYKYLSKIDAFKV